MAASGSKSKLNQSFLPSFAKSIVIFITFVLYTLIVPCVFLFVTPLYFYRFLVIFLAKVFKPEWVGIMSTRDAVVGLDDVTKRCECMLNIVITYQGVPDLEKIRSVVQKSVIEAKNTKGEWCYEKLKQYFEPWLGFAFWKWATDFKLEHHVKLCEETESYLKENAIDNNNEDGKVGTFIPEDEFIKILGPISTKPFPPKTAPWEMLIVRNYVPEDAEIHTDYVPLKLPTVIYEKSAVTSKEPKFLLIFRLHHAIGDGYSIMKLIMSHLSGEPVSKVPRAPQQRRNIFTKVLTAIGIIALTPYFHLKQFILEVDRNFWHMSAHKLTKKWHTTMSERISMEKLKEIGDKHGVAVTAVLLAGIAGGIRKFLENEGKSKFIPKVMRGLSPMPWKGHPMEALVNHWTIGIFAIPVGGKCPKKRLQGAHKSTKELKNSPILFTNFGTVPLLLAVPRWLTDIWATNWMTTMILSNFPGPVQAVTGFGQYFQEDVVFWLPLMRGTASIGVAFLSYNGGVRIALTIDSAIISEQQCASKLNRYISEEFHLLKSVSPSAEVMV